MVGIPLRRGIALLLVLAMVILIVPIATGLARRAVLSSMEATLARHNATADELGRELERGPLLEWLNRDAAHVVLEGDARTPCVRVLEDQWVTDGIQHRVDLTAWDQCGMVAIDSLERGSPLRLALPVQVLDRLPPNIAQSGLSPPGGLDELVLLAQGSDVSLLSVFPDAQESDAFALGAWVATHPTDCINVNTAPTDLLEAVLRVAGRGGLELIMAAREEGRVAPAPMASAPSLDRESRSDRAPRLVGASTSWGVRIDVEVGRAQRSWWVIYQRTSGGWTCVQRLVIPD